MSLPQHVAIIMDGNNRWAKKNMLPASYAYSRGAKVAETIIENMMKYGIPYLTLYTFSAENWQRSPKEIETIMQLLRKQLRDIKARDNSDIAWRFIGDLQKLALDIQQDIAMLEANNISNPRLTVVVALSYGGRDEIQAAALSMAQKAIEQQHTDGLSISSFLYTCGIPEPELLIRTGGDQRLSNFLLWQMAYTELYFTSILWPDFNEHTLNDALVYYQKCERKFGKSSFIEEGYENNIAC